MKTRCALSFLLFFLSATSFLRAQDDDSSGTPLAPKTFGSLPKLETDEQLRQAMERVKSINIRRYRSLKKFKEINMPQFVVELAEFLYDNDPLVTRQQQKSLVQSCTQLRSKLSDLSDKLRAEPEEAEKKHITDEIKKTAEKMIAVKLEQQALVVKMKKQEAALLDTQLEAQKEHQDEAVQSLAAQYAKVTPAGAPKH